MKSLEKLREWLDYKINRFDADNGAIVLNTGADPNALYEIADEIEREIAERYMELPVDADGVPIRVGDIMESDAFGRIEVEGFMHGAVAFWSYDPQPARLATCPVDLCHHVKPRTVEDVLEEFAQNVRKSDAEFISEQGSEAYLLAAMHEAAAEIRELLGGEGE